MNTAAMAVGALALAGVSFGAGRLSATASASATSSSTPAAVAPALPATVTCNSTSNDALADMIKDRRAKHEEAVRRANQAAQAPPKVSDIDPSPVH